MYMSGFSGYQSNDSTSTNQAITGQAGKIRELERKVERMQLSFNALWELLRDQTHLTMADLEAKMTEIDRRDGKADGKISAMPVRCPACKRVSSSKHWKCLYCGQEFEREYPA